MRQPIRLQFHSVTARKFKDVWLFKLNKKSWIILRHVCLHNGFDGSSPEVITSG